jgi:hypothetical protein
MTKPTKGFRSLCRGSEGSMTVEAAILLPCVLMIALLLISFIQLASIEVALRSAVDDTGKNIAANWLPVRQLVAEAKTKVSGTKAGAWVQEAANTLNSIRAKWSGTEEWLLQAEAFMPDFIVDLLKWEADKHARLEKAAGDAVDDTFHRVTDPILCKAFEPIVDHYANGMFLDKDKLHVESVLLPSLEAGGNAYVEIKARYEWKPPVPFWGRKITLEKTSYERAWVGEDE